MVRHILQLRIQKGKNVRDEEYPCSKSIQYLFGSNSTHVRPEKKIQKKCKRIRKLATYYKGYRKGEKFFQINANDRRGKDGNRGNESFTINPGCRVSQYQHYQSQYTSFLNIVQDVTHRTGNIYIVKLCLTLILVDGRGGG